MTTITQSDQNDSKGQSCPTGIISSFDLPSSTSVLPPSQMTKPRLSAVTVALATVCTHTVLSGEQRACVQLLKPECMASHLL